MSKSKPIKRNTVYQIAEGKDFFRFGKNGAAYTMFNDRGTGKLLILKKVPDQKNTYAFSVMNLDQLKTNEKTTKDGKKEFLSELKSGEKINRLKIDLTTKNCGDIFDKLKALNYNIEHKDFGYKDKVEHNVDYNDAIKYIPDNFKLPREEFPEEVGDQGDDDDDDDDDDYFDDDTETETEPEEKTITQMPVQKPMQMPVSVSKIKQTKSDQVLYGDDDDDDDDDDDYSDSDDELEIREKPVPSPNDEFEETPIRQTKSSDEIFKRKRKRFDPSYLDIPDIQEHTEEPTDRSKGDYEKLVSERIVGKSESNITKSSSRVSAPPRVSPRNKPKAPIPPPVNREPRNQYSEIKEGIKALMASRLLDSQLLNELMKRTEGLEETKTKLEEMKARIESSGDQYNQSLQSVGTKLEEQRGLYETKTSKIMANQEEIAKGVDKFYKDNQTNQQATNTKLASLDSSYSTLSTKPNPTIQITVDVPKDSMVAIDQNIQRTIKGEMVPHIGSLDTAISNINKGFGEIARVVKEIKEIKDSDAALLDAISTKPKITEPEYNQALTKIDGVQESINGNRSALVTINGEIEQVISNTDEIMRGVGGVLISISRAVIPRIEETGRNTQLAIAGIQTVQERNQAEIINLFKETVQTINVYFTGTYQKFEKHFSEVLQPALLDGISRTINEPMSEEFKTTRKLIADGLAEERGATSEALGKLNNGLISHFDAKTGEVTDIENENKRLIEAQGKEIAEIKRVVDSILARVNNGVYDKSLVDDIVKVLPSIDKQQDIVKSQGNDELATQLEGLGDELKAILEEQKELKAQQEKYFGKFDEFEGKFDTFSDKFDVYDKRFSEFSEKYDRDQEEKRLLRERKAKEKEARRIEKKAAEEKRQQELIDSISSIKKHTSRKASPIEAKPPKKEPDSDDSDFGLDLFDDDDQPPPPPPYKREPDDYDDGDDPYGNNGYNGSNSGSSSGSSSDSDSDSGEASRSDNSSSSESSSSESDRMIDEEEEEEEEKPKIKKKPKRKYSSYDSSDDDDKKPILIVKEKKDRVGPIRLDKSGTPPRRIDYELRDNLLRRGYTVDLYTLTNGRMTTERLGEFIDMNGELTKMADEIDKCNRKYKRALKKRDHVRANELKKKRDELVKKYHEKLNNYAKELYKESQKRKTKATIATHKYLMNKLNKL